MSGPTRAGGLIYAKDIGALSAFYEVILSMNKVQSSPDLIVLTSADFQLLIHAMPAHISSQIHINSPPELREETPIKLFFTIDSIVEARAKAATMGGSIFAEHWNGPGFMVCNANDPEGNIFQVRENAL
jgi:predicted enzyme related to lactoylglutathione lyase